MDVHILVHLMMDSNVMLCCHDIVYFSKSAYIFLNLY